MIQFSLLCNSTCCSTSLCIRKDLNTPNLYTLKQPQITFHHLIPEVNLRSSVKNHNFKKEILRRAETVFNYGEERVQHFAILL